MAAKAAGCPSATGVDSTKVIVQLTQISRFSKEGYQLRETWYPFLENKGSIVDLEHGVADRDIGAYRRTAAVLLTTSLSQSTPKQTNLDTWGCSNDKFKESRPETMRRACYLIILASSKAYSHTLAQIQGQKAQSDLNPEVRESKLKLVAYRTSYRYRNDTDLDYYLFELLRMSPDWEISILIHGTMYRSSLGLFNLDPRVVDRPMTGQIWKSIL